MRLILRTRYVLEKWILSAYIRHNWYSHFLKSQSIPLRTASRFECGNSFQRIQIVVHQISRFNFRRNSGFQPPFLSVQCRWLSFDDLMCWMKFFCQCMSMVYDCQLLELFSTVQATLPMSFRSIFSKIKKKKKKNDRNSLTKGCSKCLYDFFSSSRHLFVLLL